jgi:DNA-binding beta-propeller fold protein YncE
MQASLRVRPARLVPARRRRLGRARAAAVFLAAGAFLGAGCSDLGSDPDSQPDPYDIDYDAVSPIVYSQHIQPVMTVSCNTAACHNSVDNAGGLDLTSYAAVARGAPFGGQVVPYRPDRSPLYLHLTGDVEPLMPLALDPLRDDVIRAFKRWIEAGAMNDAGTVMYSDVTDKVFAACQGDDAVAAIDLETGILARLVTVKAPQAVFVDEPSARLYVARSENAGDNIHVYDADTYQRLQAGRAGTFPTVLGIAPGTSQLWVTIADTTASNGDAVRVLDASTLSEMDAWSLPGAEQPHGLAFSADGTRVYVANAGSSDVSIFGTDPPREITASIPLPAVSGVPEQEPRACALSADGTRLYVSASKANVVHVLKLDTVTWGTSADVGTEPWQLAVSPLTNELWVANRVDESVSILSLANPDAPVEAQRLAPLHPLDASREAFQRPMGISLQPGSNLMYVANANEDPGGDGGHHPPPGGQKNPGSVTIVHVGTRAVARVVEVPNLARSLAFLP